MTTEERFERIEHVTAGLAEERRKDREEYRQLWRDTQRRFDETASRINDLTLKMDRLAEEFWAADRQMAEEFRAANQRLAEEARAADQDLRERISALVSAMGVWMSRPPASPQKPE